MAKFKQGDKCRVIKNLLSPSCIGDIVTVESVITTYDGRFLYAITLDNSIMGYAAEGCLELI